MELGAELRQRCQPVQHLVRHALRFQRTEADTADSRNGTAQLYRIGKTAAPLHAVEPQIDAAEHQLLIAVLRKGTGGTAQLLRRQRTAAPSGIGDDAVAAKAVAAVLNLEKGTGVVRHDVAGKCLKGVVSGVGIHCATGRVCLLPCFQQLRQTAAPLGAQYQISFGNGLRLFRICLRIAAGEYQKHVRIAAAQFAQSGTGAVVARLCDSAGIEDTDIRLLRGRDNAVSGAAQHGLHGSGFAGVDFAAERQKITVQRFLSLSFFCRMYPVLCNFLHFGYRF